MPNRMFNLERGKRAMCSKPFFLIWYCVLSRDSHFIYFQTVIWIHSKIMIGYVIYRRNNFRQNQSPLAIVCAEGMSSGWPLCPFRMDSDSSQHFRSIVPRPICFCSTVSLDGKPNLAPFSYFNAICHNPPCRSAPSTSPQAHIDGMNDSNNVRRNRPQRYARQCQGYKGVCSQYHFRVGSLILDYRSTAISHLHNRSLQTLH